MTRTTCPECGWTGAHKSLCSLYRPVGARRRHTPASTTPVNFDAAAAARARLAALPPAPAPERIVYSWPDEPFTSEETKP